MTTSTAKQEQRLTNEQTAELLALTKGADSVELKLTVPEADHRSAITALGIDPLDAQIRQVFFFDTPDLTLNDSGVVVRARRVQGKGDDTVVKLRPVVPDDLSSKLRKSPTFGVEVDAMPGGFVCSGSFKGVAEADVRKTVLKKRPLGSSFEGAAGVLRATRTRGNRSRRPHRSRSHLRPEAEVRAQGVRPPARRGDVALPRLVANPRALDQMPALGGVPDRRRGTGVPHGAGRRSLGRAGDKDAQGPRVLLEGRRRVCRLIREPFATGLAARPIG